MRFHQQAKKRSKTIWVVLVFGGLACALYWFNPPVPHFFKQAIQSLGVPLWSAKNSILTEGAVASQSFVSKEKLIAENQELKKQIAILEFNAITREAVLQENRELKAILGRQGERRRIVATILTRPPTTVFDTFIVDVGRGSVTEGALVYFDEGIVLGRVSDVYTSTARVELFSSANTETDILIGPDHISTVAFGKGTGNFVALLPRDVPVSLGDVVTVPGLDNRFLGSIDDIVKDPADSFQVLRFRNPISVNSLRYVEIEQ